MDPESNRRVTIAELARILRSTDPSALLVPARILRRIIKRDRQLGGIGLQVAHHRGYVIQRDALAAFVTPDELGVADIGSLPAQVLLLVEPQRDWLKRDIPRSSLLDYWQLLLHLRVHAELDAMLHDGRLVAADIRRLIDTIGQTQFDEVRLVLQQESLLLPPADEVTAFVEFAAVYLQLRSFTPTLVGEYFPGLYSIEHVDRAVSGLVDAQKLFEATRLPGIELPAQPTESTSEESDEYYLRLMRSAERAVSRGNTVRAAILKTRASRVAPAAVAEPTRLAAANELDTLTNRLKAALHLSDDQTRLWRKELPAMLEKSDQGIWTVEARLLYDLQKVCVDHERDLYVLDLVEWAVSLGRRPIRRQLPSQKDVLICNHLRSAERNLTKARVLEANRRHFRELIEAALHDSEQRLRGRIRPIIKQVLADVDLVPSNVPERVASDKVVEELLDTISERGFTNMSDIRDALARNDLKLPDLGSPKPAAADAPPQQPQPAGRAAAWVGHAADTLGRAFEQLVHDDPLYKADRKLAVVLDGVHHRGEFYRTWMQRLSSLFFGNPIGRVITLWGSIPFGGAAITLAFVHHVVEMFVGETRGKTIHTTAWQNVVILGLFYLALIHCPPFRRWMYESLRGLWTATRFVVLDLARLLMQRPWFRRIIESGAFTWFVRLVIKPAVPAAAITLLVPASPSWSYGATVFVLLAVIVNSRLGRNMEESAGDWVIRSWQWLRVDFLPGLIKLIIDFFKRVMDLIETLLYTIDEWLRFRSGETRLSTAIKMVVGVVWFPIAYVLRAYVNLMIEPQVNPLKHFPVVTVTHKLMLPFYGYLIPALSNLFLLFLPIGKVTADTLALANIWLVPGVAGYLVWELKESWRLYKANRVPVLRAVIVGSHGETMVRLLKPGFHSGTLPKLFFKLRHAEAKALQTDRWSTVRKHRQTLSHIARSVEHFLERGLIPMLAISPAWKDMDVTVGQVTLSTNRIGVELNCRQVSSETATLWFEEQSGWLLAHFSPAGWLAALSADRRTVLCTALAGTYKLAGVELVREQIVACLPAAGTPYDIAGRNLVLWPRSDFARPVVLDLKTENNLLAPDADAPPTGQPPITIDACSLIFARTKLSWADWVVRWGKIAAGDVNADPLFDRLHMLPPPAHNA